MEKEKFNEFHFFFFWLIEDPLLTCTRHCITSFALLKFYVCEISVIIKSFSVLNKNFNLFHEEKKHEKENKKNVKFDSRISLHGIFFQKEK